VTEGLAVSVALCTYNGERFLREQLDSILAQTVPAMEIVVSDDGSVDSTVELVIETIRSHADAPRLTILRGEQTLGVAANFARAISACTGDLVALSDQDDVWREDRVAHLVARFTTEADLLLLHGDADLIDDEDRPLGSSLFGALGISSAVRDEVHSGLAFDVLMRRNIVTGATAGFRRELAELALPVPAGWLHDEWLAIAAASVGRVDLTEERLVRYRQHGANEIGARELTVTGKFRRMVEPGSERNSRLLVRAASLQERLSAMQGVAESRVVSATAKVEHESVRSALGRRRVARILPVLRELRTGRYSRFGRGAADAARDILQPLNVAA
jgi:glycosyltransferase involved in cell wall biosynthesis